MESANLHHHHHHHQLQEHQLLVGSSSSSLAAPISLYGVGIINNSSWNQNLILNNGGHDFNLSSSGDGILSNSSSRDLRQNNNNEIHDQHEVSPSLSTTTNSMIHDHQDLGFHWATTTTGRSSFIDDQYSAHDQVLHLAKIKKELISSSEYSHHQEAGTSLDEFQLTAAAASARNNYFKLHDQELEYLHDLSSSTTTEKQQQQLFLRNLISSGDHLYYCNPQNPVIGSFAHPYSSTRSGNIFSQIFPSTNISNPNPSSLSSFSSTAATHPLGMNNFQALDLLSSSPSSTKIGGNSNSFGQDSSSILFSQNNNLGRGRQVMKESHRLSSDDHHHHLDHHDLQLRSSSLNWPLNNPSKMSSCLMNVGGREVTTKRSSCSSSSSTSGLATKASHHTTAAAPKKPRLESRSSFPPIKVRKEKLGDRIANLQQLVAPFGKTDTASVLMEAIGYIKFLQEQVETLSVPYMKSSSIRNNIRQKIHRGSMAGEGEMDEPKRDLRSRGLCLVPLSCTSYITNDVDLGVNWSSPHYGGSGRP